MKVSEIVPKSAIELRAIEEHDAEFIFKWASHPEITRHTLGRRFPMQMCSIREWIDSSNVGEFPTRVAYLIVDKTPVGLVQLDQIDWVAMNAWLGVWVIPEAQKVGRGSLAVKSLLDFAAQTLGLRQIRLLVRKDNQNAITVYERLGFHQEGELVDAEYRDGIFQSLILMCIDLSQGKKAN